VNFLGSGSCWSSAIGSVRERHTPSLAGNLLPFVHQTNALDCTRLTGLALCRYATRLFDSKPAVSVGHHQ
jgi:hypothetical protein